MSSSATAASPAGNGPTSGAPSSLSPTPTSSAPSESTQRNSGRDVNYYLVPVRHPKRKALAPYVAECEDIILALGMSFEQGCAFKAIWRAAAAQHLGIMKAGYDGPVYDAEKQVHYSLLNLEVQKRKDKDMPTHHVSHADPAKMQTLTSGYSQTVPPKSAEGTSPMEQPGVLAPTGSEPPAAVPVSTAALDRDLVVTFDDYQRLAMRTAPPNEEFVDGLNHAALGFLTELAEVMAAGVDNAHACEELGDAAWYVALATAHLDRPLSKHMGVGFVDDLPATPAIPMLVSAGRYATEVKRAKIYGKEISDDMRAVMLTELRALMHGIGAECNKRGVKLSACLQQNINKLRKRFPDKFSGVAAEARADKGGLSARES